MPFPIALQPPPPSPMAKPPPAAHTAPAAADHPLEFAEPSHRRPPVPAAETSARPSSLGFLPVFRPRLCCGASSGRTLGRIFRLFSVHHSICPSPLSPRPRSLQRPPDHRHKPCNRTQKDAEHIEPVRMQKVIRTQPQQVSDDHRSRNHEPDLRVPRHRHQ